MPDLTPEKQRFALAIVAVLALMACLSLLAWAKLDTGVRETLVVIITAAVVSPVKDIYGFYFGSSQGSKDKDATIAQAQDKAP